jgi:hypothetical protein
MARIVLKYLNGKEETYYGGASVFNGFVYIWAPGTRKGKQPIAKIQLSQLHSKKRTGQKGIFIYKN